jgi:recombination protein RecR
MTISPKIDALLETFQGLPGIGPRSAQRLVYHILQRDRATGARLADALRDAVEHIGHCQQCRMLAEGPLCGLCQDPRRNRESLCIVEGPSDVLALERAGVHRGLYFVLMGQLSPLDGIGPEALGLDRLAERLANEPITELILATSSTVEGEATAQYVAEMAEGQGIPVWRIAHGVPFGGELDYVDATTLSRAFSDRRRL